MDIWLKKSTIWTATHSLRSSPSGSCTAWRRSAPLPSVASACFNKSWRWVPSGILFLGYKGRQQSKYKLQLSTHQPTWRAYFECFLSTAREKEVHCTRNTDCEKNQASQALDIGSSCYNTNMEWLYSRILIGWLNESFRNCVLDFYWHIGNALARAHSVICARVHRVICARMRIRVPSWKSKFCFDLFSATFDSWNSHILTITFRLISVLVCSVMKTYFLPHWRLDNDQKSIDLLPSTCLLRVSVGIFSLLWSSFFILSASRKTRPSHKILQCLERTKWRLWSRKNHPS